MRQNTKSILLRLNAEEYVHLQSLTKTTGLKMEPLLRQLIMGVQLKPRSPEEYAAILRELSAIGNNINQIAYWANVRKGVSAAQINDAVALVNRVWQLVKDSF